MENRFFIEKFGNLTMVNEIKKKRVTQTSYNEIIGESIDMKNHALKSI